MIEKRNCFISPNDYMHPDNFLSNIAFDDFPQNKSLFSKSYTPSEEHIFRKQQMQIYFPEKSLLETIGSVKQEMLSI